ncbi:MAG: alkaline phosphatase PhoX [Pseudomonadota bacterium]
MNNRRSFLRTSIGGSAALSLAPLFATLQGCSRTPKVREGLNLVADKEGLCDLPAGFSYRVISPYGDTMSDGHTVPGYQDGMGCFSAPDGGMILVRNHEISLYFPTNPKSPVPELAYDPDSSGGTTTIWLDAELNIQKHYLSLTGTIRNCSGGKTPWDTWITCEEAAGGPWEMGRRHGYAFEVDPTSPLRKAMPLTAMGRFNREAVAVHERTGVVYQTEDNPTGCLYRFIPQQAGKLAAGGRLQALALIDSPAHDTTKTPLEIGSKHACHWVDVDEPDPEENNLRIQARENGAAVFVRGEGIVANGDAIYFACTDGGEQGLGQIFCFHPNEDGGELELVYESSDASVIGNPDNLAVAPWGDLVVCEDSDLDVQCLAGVTASGDVYHIAANTRSEWSGACFSPDGTVLFANIQDNPGMTVAISGPWDTLRQT